MGTHRESDLHTHARCTRCDVQPLWRWRRCLPCALWPRRLKITASTGRKQEWRSTAILQRARSLRLIARSIQWCVHVTSRNATHTLHIVQGTRSLTRSLRAALFDSCEHMCWPRACVSWPRGLTAGFGCGVAELSELGCQVCLRAWPMHA
jgi:hypothetical protein